MFSANKKYYEQYKENGVPKELWDDFMDSYQNFLKIKRNNDLNTNNISLEKEDEIE